MKKLLLLTAGTLLAAASASAQWAVVGGYCDWKFENATTFTGEGDNLSCEIANLTSGFKIVDITDNNWNTQYGTSTKIVANQVYTLDPKVGDAEPANIEFGDNILSISNATVKWNPSNAQLEIVASQNDIETGYPTLYATGSFNNWPNPQDSQYVGVLDGAVYTFEIDLGNSGNVSFKVASSGWGLEVAGPTENVVVGYEPVEVSIGGKDLKTNLTGLQTLKLNYDELKMWFVEKENEGGEPETPAAKVWAVVGAYSDPAWNFDSSTVLEGEGDVLSCTIDYLISDFKIVEISNNNWNTQYGTSTPIEIGKTYTLDGKNGDADPSNINFAGSVLGVKNAKVTWNPETAVLQVDGDDDDIVVGYPVLYVTGSFCDWAEPGKEGSVLMTEKEGVYTASVNLGEEEKVEFKLAGEGWSNEIAGGMEIGFSPVEVSKGGNNLTSTLQGQQTLVFDYDSMTMNFISNGDSGVDAIGVAGEETVEFYNLQGVKVSNPQNGLFIIKKGNKTYKAVIK